MMQNHYYDPPEITAKHETSHDATAALPSVSFSSGSVGRGGAGVGTGGHHELEYQVHSGVYMITMASGSEDANDSQAATILASTKTVASVVANTAPLKATKKLIFQLDDQQRDTFHSEEKV